MNFIFNSSADMSEICDYIKSDVSLERCSFENKVLEPHTNTNDKLNGCNVPSYDLNCVHDGQIFDSKNIAINNPEENQLILSSNQKSTWFCNGDSLNLIDAVNAMIVKESEFCRINCTIESVRWEYSEDLSFASNELQKSEKAQEPQINSKTLCLTKSKLNTGSGQKYPQNEKITTSQNNERINKTRWGRKEDILAFTILRELCSQENFTIDTFWCKNSAITDKHHYLISELVDRLNWKRDTQTMLKRIQYLGKNQKMSVREMKLFRRLRKKAIKENKPFNLEEIANQFPGKLASTLEWCMKSQKNVK